VTRIAGHVDAVAEGRSGLLADGRDELLDGMDRVLSDPGLRAQLSAGASDHAARFTWAATARGTLEVLAAEAMLRRRHP
jgi:glycosyltransferase involved in cell wall biosynthesis